MYVLHAAPDFASFVVHIVLEEIGVPYRIHLLDLDAGDLARPEHRAVNPFGKIPALQTPDGPMFETAAILLWLADRHAALAPAPTAPDRAAFLSFYFFNNFALHGGAMDLVHADRPAGEAAAERVARLTHDKLRAQLATLDAYVARHNPAWLSAESPSIFAYHLAMLMRWINAFAYLAELSIKPDAYPALQAILRAMELQPAAIRAAAAEGITGKFFSDPQG